MTNTNKIGKSLDPLTVERPPFVYYGPTRVGDRVYVYTNKGVQYGRVRYLGSTEFAPGYWAGLELDEPMGKNDGSVAGKRYFWCPTNYGLFTPASKVIRSATYVRDPLFLREM